MSLTRLTLKYCCDADFAARFKRAMKTMRQTAKYVSLEEALEDVCDERRAPTPFRHPVSHRTMRRPDCPYCGSVRYQYKLAMKIRCVAAEQRELALGAA